MTHDTKTAPLALAQVRAAAARARLSATVAELKYRMAPKVLAQDVAGSVKARGLQALVTVADTAQRRPARFGVAVALVGLVLARKHIARLARRR